MNATKLSIFQKIYKLRTVALFEDTELRSSNFPYTKPLAGYTYDTVEITAIEVVKTPGTGQQMIKINGDSNYLFPVVDPSTPINTTSEWYSDEADIQNLVVGFNKMERERAIAMIEELGRKVKTLETLTERSLHAKK